MKSKLYLILTVLFMIPSFCSSLMVGAISVEWLITINHSSHLANMFLTGKFNYGFTLIIFAMGFFSTCITIFFALWVKQHATAIDKLEKIKLQDKREDLLYLEQIKRFIDGK